MKLAIDFRELDADRAALAERWLDNDKKLVPPPLTRRRWTCGCE